MCIYACVGLFAAYIKFGLFLNLDYTFFVGGGVSTTSRPVLVFVLLLLLFFGALVVQWPLLFSIIFALYSLEWLIWRKFQLCYFYNIFVVVVFIYT